jgi:hypothetical protein
LPHKTDPVLIVDADAVLAFSIDPQLLQLIFRRHSQIFQFHGGMHRRQFPLGYFPQVRRRHSLAFPGVPKLFRVGSVFAAKGLNHEDSLALFVNNVER